MNEFEKGLLKYLGKARLEHIQSYKIAIAGAGGLGSNCAWNLVRCGFKKFIVVDFDRIENSNLNRQFYFSNQLGEEKAHTLKENLLKINPDLDITAVCTKITNENILSLFEDCQIIVEAFDKVEYKKMIIEAYMEKEQLLVAASGLAGWGNSDEIKVNKIKDTFYLIGDLNTEVSTDTPPMSPRVNIAAAKQADTILEFVLGKMA
ncbi:MAG: thiamine biosynthesis protein ThiF [Firmicutes bacterium HGW-Firmicutes-1]|nr:MAG: thiamine biosynthesis protein ThiF [Firmicutes bacterium HGW-Firmicutes-1]